MIRTSLIAAAVLLSVTAVGAQTTATTSSSSPETLYLGDDNHVTLNIPAALADRMVATPATSPQASASSTSESASDESSTTAATTTSSSSASQGAKTGGYRVQVFLDNNSRTAKSEARARARNIAEQFPNYPTYVVYSSPYWRLRVGNFRSHTEADAAAAEISAAFPSYAREIRVVRDRIVVSSD